ncbi:bactofilin family protein [Halofilum ochraceum]|uniref:bactofilin family protein n=1 Tax=Halofilum ochraceum TaxID=1611323 RepID=UPI00082E71E2|nr:polymer-forming cytoskeletal protein [Halofilum ochraceum]
MLGNSSKKSKGSGNKVDTLIGHETEIVGDVHFSGGLHIDGVIKGNVYADGESDSVAIISERGRVEGELRVPNLLINGFVAGDVFAGGRLDLAKNARVRGDVYYHTMEMAGGAEINGKLVRTDDVQQRYLGHEGSADEPGREPPGEPSLDIDADVVPGPSAEPDPSTEPDRQS